jgi:serine/threonine protein kinase
MRARDYEPGEQVPGTVYQVLRLIGAGGMGTVYDVEDTTIGKRYVLKTLHPKLGAREDLAKRIQNEARTLAKLHHPNIVEVITAGVTADDLKLPYYLMERLSGQSLRGVLEKKGQLDLSHAYHIGIDLLDALDHAHDHSVIHRDVKPDNIFLHRTLMGVTVTKLLDFGIMSMLDASSADTAGRFLGTLRYAAPEQLLGEKPTAKTDLYSAALVLYEIVAGRGPFDDEGDAHRIAAAHVHKAPPSVSQFVQVPRELDALLTTALSKRPDARPRDAFSFAASLRSLKRRVDDTRHRETSENRVTATAVIGPASTPRLPRRESSAGVLATSTSPQSAPRPTGAPKSTLIGVPPPTVAPAVSQTSPFPSSVIEDARSRVAVTNSIAGDTVPTPQHGTQPFPPASAPRADRAFGEADTEIQWPQERPPTQSDGPQIQSLPAFGSPRRVRPIAFGLIGTAALVTMAWVLVTGLRHVSSASESVDSRGAVVSQGAGATDPKPVVGAPTIAPPQPDMQQDPPAVSDAPAPSASTAPRDRKHSRTKSHAKGAASASNGSSDLPGPGF